ncbi:type VI secretion system baseplate subunit TssG [Photobacterium makurazakiensis]|uniref:type VI secretion system baseplate subunit TssG n=1 Tax=Photobacterium makurazakiensis TaxID=2910234 RepID=UPI003D12CE02
MSLEQLIHKIDKDDFYRSTFTIQQSVKNAVDYGELGTDTLPANEYIRFKVSQHLGFPGNAVESVGEITDGHGNKKIELYVNFMGLTGASGALPLHYTELIMQRNRLKDEAISEFFDLFNHRLISLNYRAWEKYQFSIQHAHCLNGKETSMDSALRSLTGANQYLNVFFGGLFAKSIRNTQSLRQILMRISGCNIEIREFIGRWMQLDRSEQTQLGSGIQPEGKHAQLGVSSILGQKVWDISSAIEIDIQANDSDKALAVMGNGQLLLTLKQVARNFVPPSIDVNWCLTTTCRNIPVMKLSKIGPSLGRGGALMSGSKLKDKNLNIPLR